MAPAVTRGNIVTISKESLVPESAKKVTVKWSQGWSGRSQDYFVSTFTDEASGQTGVAFVQVNLLDQLKAKAKTPDFRFAIDDSWQYGQRTDGSNRFIVYHDKNNTPYQHRFVENIFTQLGDGASKFASFFGAPATMAIGLAQDLAKSFIGDYLRTF